MNDTPEQTTSTAPVNTACHTHALLQELQGVRTELATWNALQQWGFNQHALRALLMQFLKGTAFGLGSLVGATIVLYVLLFVLSRMEVIPILGDWIHQITQHMSKTAAPP